MKNSATFITALFAADVFALLLASLAVADLMRQV
jgi:hypothetical protein